MCMLYRNPCTIFSARLDVHNDFSNNNVKYSRSSNAPCIVAWNVQSRLYFTLSQKSMTGGSTQPRTKSPCLEVCLWLIPWCHQHMQHCIISACSFCNSMLKCYRNKEFPCKVMSLQLREESIERGLESFPERRCQVCWILNHPEHILMGLTVFIHRKSSTKSQVQLLSTSPSTFLFIFFNLSIHKAFWL